jgi:putative DNA primase/helicase
MQDRLRSIAKGMGRNLDDPSNFRIITQDLQPNGIPDLATKEGQEIVESVLGDAELLILDNLSCLVRRVQENESDSWLPIQEWLLKLRRKGISVLFIHHAGKSGIQRGTSRREDVLDAVIALRHPPSYKHEEGAKFIVKNEKPRGLVGKDVEPFVAQLHVSVESGLRWEIIENKEIDSEEHYEKVIELRIEGKSIRDIVKILQISRSKVHALIIKARENGDLSDEDEQP